MFDNYCIQKHASNQLQAAGPIHVHSPGALIEQREA